MYGRAVPRPLTAPAAAALLAALASCSSPPEAAIDAAPWPRPSDAAVADAGWPDAATGTPDLTINEGRARIDLAVTTREFSPDSCELTAEEDCVLAPGTRTLLHFGVETPNVGTGDLVIGRPDPDNPQLEFSACHDHYHLQGYASYRLVDEAASEVAVGRKQAFCLLDTRRWDTDDPTVSASARYHCEYQGIQRGWADVYHTRLPCQFIDVTGLPAGAYTLEIELNADRVVEELDHDNNRVSIPIELGSADLAGPTEPCPEDIDQASSAGLHRECGWTLTDTFDCTPGAIVGVGCSSQCGLGSCTGDTMMRICDAARADGNCSYPAALDPSGSTDDFGGGSCPCDLSVDCPPSGQIAVYTAPRRVGEPFSCDLVFEP